MNATEHQEVEMERDDLGEINDLAVQDIIDKLKKCTKPLLLVDANQFKKRFIHHGFLDEKGCPPCGCNNFYDAILLRPVMKDKLMSLKRMYLLTETTLLCPVHKRKQIFYCRNAIDNLSQKVKQPSEIMGHTAPVLYQEDRTCISNTLPISSANTMAAMESSLSTEAIPSNHTFGATVVPSCPQKQNNFPGSTIQPIPLPPLSPLTTKIWSHIDNNLVADNSYFAVPNAEEAYLKFRESNPNKYAVNNEVVPVRRMAYTRNFDLQPPENPSTSNIVSSINSNVEESNGRRGKKILGKGIYKK